MPSGECLLKRKVSILILEILSVCDSQSIASESGARMGSMSSWILLLLAGVLAGGPGAAGKYSCLRGRSTASVAMFVVCPYVVVKFGK